MLVLTRRVGESVLIGGEIEVTLLDIKGDRVRIGVNAPRETRIQRAEIVEAVGEQNAASAATADAATAKVLGEAIARLRGNPDS
jgi:carbon storage regulator